MIGKPTLKTCILSLLLIYMDCNLSKCLSESDFEPLLNADLFFALIGLCVRCCSSIQNWTLSKKATRLFYIIRKTEIHRFFKLLFEHTFFNLPDKFVSIQIKKMNNMRWVWIFNKFYSHALTSRILSSSGYLIFITYETFDYLSCIRNSARLVYDFGWERMQKKLLFILFERYFN